MTRIIFTLLFVFSSLRAVSQAPVVRAHLEPANNILVGQPVRLIVSVFVPNYFTGGVDFPEFEIENAILVLPQDRPENSNTQINGATYAGITQTYVIYPQQAGDFHIPPAHLSVPYAIAPPKSIIATAPLPALTFHAEIPETAKDLPYFLPTTNLTITQQWSRPLKGLRTGDSIERTITVTASKMQAMLIPPLPLDHLDGIRIYAGEPVVHDQKTARGDFIYGRRVQSAKYLIQKAGDYTLPALELQWWNLSTHRLVTATLPEVKFTAVINPGYVAELPPPLETPIVAPTQRVNIWRHYRSKVRLTLDLIAGAVVFVLAVRMLYLKRAWLTNWWDERRISESASFRRLLHAVRTNDPKQTYIDLIEWFRMTQPGVPLHEAVKSSSDTTLASEVGLLAETLYGRRAPNISSQHPTKSWDGSKLLTCLKQQRRVHKAQQQTFSKERLRALNPCE